LIVAGDVYNKALSYGAALQEGTRSMAIEDIMEFLYETSKVAQDVRLLDAQMNKRPAFRDRRLFEERTGLSAETGKPKTPTYYESQRTPHPFSLPSLLMKADIEEGELGRLLGPMLSRPNPVNIPRQLMSSAYYEELASRKGIEEARRQMQEDAEREMKRDAIMGLQ
jgi:hypothetical protein